ncbi:MAG TPA: helix-turn-helix domain-containing protein [Gaiellaceae bacterium]|nr:helix-turn-helix domain-containing protein [Gaiellaceae bacterium]
MNIPERQLLTVAEVAEATGFSTNAVYRAIWSGELRASKLRGRLRVQAADIDVWIDSNVVVASPRSTHHKPRGVVRPPRRSGSARGLRELLKTK